MSMINQYLSQDVLDVLLISQTFIILGLFLSVFLLARNIKSFQKRWATLFLGTSVPTLERIFCQNMEQIEHLKFELNEAKKELQQQDNRLAKTIQHVGCVRFDAFQDVGGKQSFAIALYDDHGDGVILTSMIGRQECRVYGKPIHKGAAERQLLEEESKAIQLARQTSTDREGSLA